MEDMNMTNGMDPDKMTGEERMAEVSMLLSLAMMRLWPKRRRACGSTSPERDFSRDFGGNSLGCPVETLPPVAAGKP